MFTIVIDTNILITASEDDFNDAREVIDLVTTGKVRAIATRQIIDENKLLLKKRVVKKAVKQELANYFNYVRLIRATSRERIVEEDREDDKFVHCALAASADFIITQDRHLLDIEKTGETEIVTPADFLARLKRREDPDGKNEWADWVKQLLGKQ